MHVFFVCKLIISELKFYVTHLSQISVQILCSVQYLTYFKVTSTAVKAFILFIQYLQRQISVALLLGSNLWEFKNSTLFLLCFSFWQQFCLCLERAIGTIRDHMGSLVSGLCELLVGYFSVLPSSGLLDVASTVGRIFITSILLER